LRRRIASAVGAGFALSATAELPWSCRIVASSGELGDLFFDRSGAPDLDLIKQEEQVEDADATLASWELSRFVIAYECCGKSPLQTLRSAPCAVSVVHRLSGGCSTVAMVWL
jgi:hypothetical protein